MAQWSSGWGLGTDFQDWKLQIEGLDPLPNYRTLLRLAQWGEGWGRTGAVVLSTGHGGKGRWLLLGHEPDRGPCSSTPKTGLQNVTQSLTYSPAPQELTQTPAEKHKTTHSHIGSEKTIRT